ncbi:hypothetical protein Pint_11702 [Pistacia integerrima]|uniref:Uncharacterized protein n=1 Tax=Pistacia integerrima TaxID=434235 RepID=A0ACC0XK40_9ROSI|nr:hypothetical protein Pint_11702 [Pistacia integerrima]
MNMSKIRNLYLFNSLCLVVFCCFSCFRCSMDHALNLSLTFPKISKIS